MWLFIAVAFLAVLAVFGGTLAGGIYTIVLIPLAVIALISAIGYSYFSGAATRRGGGEGREAPRPLPTGQQRSSGHAPTTPEGLADARRARQ